VAFVLVSRDVRAIVARMVPAERHALGQIVLSAKGGAVDDSLLEALEHYLKRQRKRLQSAKDEAAI
jgi:hypothetical protein